MFGRIAARATLSLQTYAQSQAIQGTNRLLKARRHVPSFCCSLPNNARGIHCSQSLQTETYYSDSHEWLRVDGDTGTIGITDHAQSKLGDIVFVELPEVGTSFEKDESFAVIESVKAASDLMMPVTAEITDSNTALQDTPELVNNSPTEDGWIVKVKLSDTSELNNLMDKAAYDKMASEDSD
uniref:Glycine cleavage system H protein n=1 Tax=Phallusia mammillata TaxID=59560 RepID=A0A6F9DE92_9ASCI|nr:glycine cleavage system H protein, mitochondrial-like [Phallusia mammillata]